MRISVCIPAYNRSIELPSLLDSIFAQDYPDFEVVICEDKSPQREEIRNIVEHYKSRYPQQIAYFENSENLGYDGNLRHLISQATGDYCLFMGNDDLMCPGALSVVAEVIDRHPNVGVVLRSYAAFDGTPDKVSQVFRYFDSERFFPAGADTVVTFYRRSVVISGMVIHRGEAQKFYTDRFDGTLLYQLYLVANVLATMNGVFTPEILALYRNGGIPDFGSSASEKGKFVPKVQTPESSVYFMRGMLEIAKHVEDVQGFPVFRRIIADIGNYSYPILAIQSGQPLGIFIGYAYQLAKLGFWRNKMFHLYFWAILFLGSRRVDRLIGFIKKRLGHTPALGDVYKGELH